MLTLTAPVASLASRAMTGVLMFRSYFFGTTDEGAALQLPPVVHFGDLMHMFRTHGIWGHHLVSFSLPHTYIHTQHALSPRPLPITLITPNTVFYSRCSLASLPLCRPRTPTPLVHPHTSDGQGSGSLAWQHPVYHPTHCLGGGRRGRPVPVHEHLRTIRRAAGAAR